MLETGKKEKLGPLQMMVYTLEAAEKTLGDILDRVGAIEGQLIGPGSPRGNDDRRTPPPFEEGALGDLAAAGLRVLHLASEVLNEADRLGRRLEGGRNPEAALAKPDLNRAERTGVWEMVTGVKDEERQEERERVCGQ